MFGFGKRREAEKRITQIIGMYSMVDDGYKQGDWLYVHSILEVLEPEIMWMKAQSEMQGQELTQFILDDGRSRILKDSDYARKFWDAYEAAPEDAPGNGSILAKMMAQTQAEKEKSQKARLEDHSSKSPKNNEQQAMTGIEERKEAAVKQTCLFMDASLLLVDNETLNKKNPKVCASLYFLGAADSLTQHYKLDFDEFSDVALLVLKYFGLAEQNARLFLKEYLTFSQDPYSREALIEGGTTIMHWLSGKDKNAPLRLFHLVDKWKDIQL